MASTRDSEGAKHLTLIPTSQPSHLRVARVHRLPALTLFSAATCGTAGTAQTCPPPFGPSSEVHLHRPQGHCIQDTQTSVVRLCGPLGETYDFNFNVCKKTGSQLGPGATLLSQVIASPFTSYEQSFSKSKKR